MKKKCIMSVVIAYNQGSFLLSINKSLDKDLVS